MPAMPCSLQDKVEPLIDLESERLLASPEAPSCPDTQHSRLTSPALSRTNTLFSEDAFSELRLDDARSQTAFELGSSNTSRSASPVSRQQDLLSSFDDIRPYSQPSESQLSLSSFTLKSDDSPPGSIDSSPRSHLQPLQPSRPLSRASNQSSGRISPVTALSEPEMLDYSESEGSGGWYELSDDEEDASSPPLRPQLRPNAMARA
jgi:hypothetical protein